MLFVMIVLGGVGFASSQTDTLLRDSSEVQKKHQVKEYTISVQASGGYSNDLSSYTGRSDLTVNRNHYYGYGQVRWLPGNLLTGSIEVGYVRFYSVSGSGGAYSVRNAIPIALTFSMEPFYGFEIAGGFGLGVLSSQVSGTVGTAHSSSVSMLTSGAITYLVPVGSNVKVGAEARISYMDLYDDKVVGLGLVIRHCLFSY